MIQPPLTSDALLAALYGLAGRWRLVRKVIYGRRDSVISRIEALAHEISHRLLTGPDFENRLRAMEKT